MTAESRPIDELTGVVPDWITTRPDASVRVAVGYPDPTRLVITVSGEVDAASIDRLQETVWPRLSASVRSVVVDLTAVGFLGIPGLQLLTQAHMRCQQRGIGLRLVVAGHEVAHALHISGIDALVDCYPTLVEALDRDR
ncbi:STAS domain-containing protein [Saccharopolyspora sp. CA-218241]|uniref:STAS domain-containing protein n=1 Tax=Saccharopolyspora sp. CA-218241 TaxID=3240027 RepID=UPI003D95624A